MYSNRKSSKADLRTYYPIFLEIGMIIVLLVFLIATKLELPNDQAQIGLTESQEIVKMEEIVQTKHLEKPPPPPRPPVPVEVPNDEVIEDEVLNLDAELDLDTPLDMPPPLPEQQEVEEEFFLVVEEMPKLKGGLTSIQQCINYPEMAQKAGVEGKVIVQFIVDEQGNVEDSPMVVRGIGAGADQEAIRCVEQAHFVPGRQRGKPVRVQFSVPVVYNLTN